MFIKFHIHFVFNKMVLDRKKLSFPSKWEVNHLKRWRNGEVEVKTDHKLSPKFDQKLWPWHCHWLVYCFMCEDSFFYQARAFYKNVLSIHVIRLLYLKWYVSRICLLQRFNKTFHIEVLKSTFSDFPIGIHIRGHTHGHFFTKAWAL